MWLLYVSCAWVAGIFLGSKVSLPLLALSLGLIPFALIPFLPGSKKTLIVAGLCLLALFGGGLRFPSSLPPADEHSLCFYNDKGIVEIQGMVAEEPDIRDRLCLLTFSASEIIVNGEREEVSGTALIQVPRYPAYRYGDVLKITGKLETPEPFDTFDYKSYLARQGIYSVIYYPKVEVVGRGEGFKPWQWIYSLRERLSASLARALPEPQGSLAQGILLGLRRQHTRFSQSSLFQDGDSAHISHLWLEYQHRHCHVPQLGHPGLWQAAFHIYLAGPRGYMALCPARRDESAGNSGGNHGKPVFNSCISGEAGKRHHCPGFRRRGDGGNPASVIVERLFPAQLFGHGRAYFLLSLFSGVGEKGR